MTVLNGFKLVVGKRPVSASPIVARRNKMAGKIAEQLALCEAQKSGQPYQPKVTRTYTNKQTGERMSVDTIKRVRQWFYISPEGKINLTLKYGSKVLPLNKKGANAIELATGDELIATLKNLQAAVLNGDLDEAINEVSEMTRNSFKK
jgi:hypothetical protein